MACLPYTFFYDLRELFNVIVKYFSFILMNFFSKERYWQIFLRKLLTLFENKLFSAHDRNKGKTFLRETNLFKIFVSEKL
jgi:hypothetical protein